MQERIRTALNMAGFISGLVRRIQQDSLRCLRVFKTFLVVISLLKLFF